MARKFVVPKEGLKVLDNSGRVIAKQGAWVSYTTLISRLVRDGDLTVTKKKPEQEHEEQKAGREEYLKQKEKEDKLKAKTDKVKADRVEKDKG